MSAAPFIIIQAGSSVILIRLINSLLKKLTFQHPNNL